MSKLDGKRVLITGGAQGIGLAMAIKFAERGAEIIIADINEEKLAEAKAGLEARAIVAGADIRPTRAHLLACLSWLDGCPPPMGDTPFEH